MIRSTIYSRTLRVLGTNSTAYPQTDFNSDLNEALALRTMKILRLNGYKHISQKHQTTSFFSITGLVAEDIGYNGEYPLPTDLLTLERVEVSYDGSSWNVISKENGNLYDISQNEGSEQNQAEIQANFSKTNPMATVVRGSAFIRPLNDGDTVTSGLHFYFSPRQVDLDEDTDEPVFEENLHQALIYDCAEIEIMAHPDSYSSTKEKRVLTKKNQVDKEFNKFYRARMKPLEKVETKQESFK